MRKYYQIHINKYTVFIFIVTIIYIEHLKWRQTVSRGHGFDTLQL